MSTVRLESVSKVFGETVAVHRLDLTIEEGEFFSLLGPSGCGKTTTLRMIGGFEEPTEGRVYLGDREVTHLPPYRRDVNTVFQSYALFPHLDVFENVAYGLRRKDVPRPDIVRRADEMLELVDLAGYGSRRVDQLSGGQQQRVALARALVNKPQVLLLDEPLGALDLKLRRQMQLELKRIQSEVGITFVYVTHDQEEAMTMSNRIGVMNAGRLEQIGAPQDIYELPETEFVAAFLGASNLLDAEVADTGAETARVRLSEGTLIEIPASRLPVKQGSIRIGIRPEKLHLEAMPGNGADVPSGNGLEVTIRLSTYTGVSTTYECETADGSIVVVYSQNLSRAPATVAPGTKVLLTWHPQHTFAVAKGRGRVEEGAGS